MNPAPWLRSLVITAAALACHGTAAYASPVPVPNGDFETTASGTGLLDWKFPTYSAASQVPPAGRDAGFIRGDVSLHLKHGDAEEKKGAKAVVIITANPLGNIFGGAEYELSFYARSPVPNQRLDAMFYTNADKKPHFYKGKSFLLSDTWTKYRFSVKMMTAEDWDDRSLFVRFDLPYGEAYLDEVALDGTITADQQRLLDQKAAQEAAAPKNLLVNPGFELGWLGWGPSLYRRANAPYAEKEIPSGLDFTTKQEGAASFRLEPNDTLASQPCRLKINQPYTFSFYARAVPGPGPKHQVSVLVLNPKWKMFARTLTVGKDLGPEWKRYSIPVLFTEAMTPYLNSMYIRIDSQDNTVWLDALQFEKGPMTEYAAAPQAGILTPSADGLFALGKPETVEVAVAATGGIPKPLTVSLKATDVYASVLWEKTLPVAPTPDELVKIPVTLPNTALGVANVSLTVTAAGEPAPLSVNQWRYCVTDGRPGAIRRNPLFGMENAIGRAAAWVEEFNEHMADMAGAGFSRVFIGQGGVIDPDDPVQLENLKQQVSRKKAGGKIVMLNIDLPKGARLSPNAKTDVEPDEAVVAAEEAAFAAYAGKIAAGLKDRVDYYQLLNEPNIWNARTGAKRGLRLMPPERYARFLAAGAKAIRAACPQAKIAANTNGVDVVYTDALFAAGAARSIDVFTFHSYRSTPETPPTYEDIRRLRTLLDRYGKGMPIFNDEQYFGVRNPNGGGGEVDRDYFSDSEQDHAGRILQNYLHHIAAERVPWSVFSTGETLFRRGYANPVYFYYGYGGYRFLSQTLYDITAAANVEVHPSVRAFLFERRDGVKIVSLNTRVFGVKGGLRNAGADAAFDANGNRIPPGDVPLGYLPVYLMFGKDTPADAVAAAVKHADFYGLDAPLRARFEAAGGTLTMTVENGEDKPADTTLAFTAMPEGWSAPAPVRIAGLAGRAARVFTFPVGEKEFSWNKNYPVGYRAEVGDSIVTKTVRLPSVFAARRAIAVDGDLADWQGIPDMTLAEENLSPDFSGGKLPHTGAQDLSAKVGLAWDEQNVYCAVQVADDVPAHGDGDETMFWKYDSVQLYFDMQNEAGKLYDTNDATYVIGLGKGGTPVAYLDKNPTGRYVGAANADRGIDGDVRVAYRKTGTGGVYEIAFPRVALPYLPLKDGTVFGFSVLVNDNDGAGRKQGVTLGPKGTEPYGRPERWRTVRLTAGK